MARAKKPAPVFDDVERLEVAPVRAALLVWYAGAARDLPWRRTRDPYALWVAEVMLQQTRVETVLPYYARFLGRFPTVDALAKAPIDDVLSHWSGLGYYRRARLLHAGAKHVEAAHGGRVPADVEAIAAIPGVGRYTTGAIASQAFDLEAPIVDGNVARFLSRLCAIDDDVKRGPGVARVWKVAEAMAIGPTPGLLNNALMELGATICVPHNPRCLLCPVRTWCRARAEGREQTLPLVSKSIDRPIIREIAAILRVEGEPSSTIVIARRVAEGLFGGLWEPPRVATTSRLVAQKRLTAMLGADVALNENPLRQIDHVLTHRTMKISVFSGTIASRPMLTLRDEYDAIEVGAIDRLDALGVSTFARKILDARSPKRTART